MVPSRQGLTRNESLRSETPSFLFDFLKHTPSDLFPKAFHFFGKAGESPLAGRTRAGGPPLGLGAVSAGFLRVRVRGARCVRGNVSRSSGFLRSHPGFGDEVGRMRR